MHVFRSIYCPFVVDVTYTKLQNTNALNPAGPNPHSHQFSNQISNSHMAGYHKIMTKEKNDRSQNEEVDSLYKLNEIHPNEAVKDNNGALKM